MATLIKDEEAKLWAAIDSALGNYVRAVKDIKARTGLEEGEKRNQVGESKAKELQEYLKNAKNN